MAKAPFRFFRGEFNGAYVLNYLLSRNAAVLDMVDELIYHGKKVWKLEGEVSGGEVPVRPEELVGIAMYAGVLRPIQYIENNVGSIRFTTSTTVGGKERSERGLFDVETETFKYIRTEQDEYGDDIVTETTATKRSTLVPEGTTPTGYVAAGTQVFNEDGIIIPGSILSTPPVGVPYTEYYGDHFLTFEEVFKNETGMEIAAFKAYFESIMQMRRSGASIEGLLSVTSILTEDYIVDLEVQYVGPHYVLLYSINDGSLLTNRSGRLAAWFALIEKRFKEFVPVERP